MGIILYARWVLAPGETILENGAVAIEGPCIRAIGTRSFVGRTTGDRIVNLGDILLMPGLINMHTHLEEGIARGILKQPEETFASWIAKKASRIRTANLEQVLPSIRLGIREALSQGITTIVDSSRTGASIPVLQDEQIRSWVIHELIDDEDTPPATLQHIFETRLRVARCDRIRIGLGPHALFSLAPQAHRNVIRLCNERQCLWATHIAESAEELQAFSEHQGDLYFYITRKRPWPFGATPRGPMHYAISEGLIPDNAVLFHCNYVNGQELELLAAKNVSIVTCMRYNELIGHKSFPLDVAVSRKISICAGTELLPDAGANSLFDELYLARQSYPHLTARDLVRWVTVNPARALKMDGRIGTLAAGAYADLIGVSFVHDSGADILEELLVEEPDVRFVMVNGEEVIENY